MRDTKATAWAHGDLLGGRYELRTRAGSGGVAEVWRASDVRLRREVAVKLLSGPAAADPRQRARVEREARALAAVAHRNIVQVFDYAEEPLADGRTMPYIVMELVEGPDLARYVADRGPLPVDEASPLIADVLRGVAAAHAIGIVHGDLKPGNVLLSRVASGWEPKVVDFGVARVLHDATGMTVPVATPAYAPPEVLRGERPTPASDVYSVGCLAYELMSGVRPFTGESFWEAARQHMEAPAPRLGNAPAALSEALVRAMAKDPSERFQTALAFADAIAPQPPSPETTAFWTPEDERRDGEPEPAGDGTEQTVLVAPEPTETLPPRVRRRRTPVVRRPRIAPGLLVALAGVVALTIVGARPSTVRVPALLNRPLEAARAAAAAAGLTVRTSEVDRGGLAGTVVGQRPDAGTLLERGRPVELEVTRGAPQVGVPDVDGRPVQDAIATLTGAGFRVHDEVVVDFSAEPRDPAAVIRTEPPSGRTVDEGSEVRLWVTPQAVREPPDDGREIDRPGRGKDPKNDRD